MKRSIVRRGIISSRLCRTSVANELPTAGNVKSVVTAHTITGRIGGHSSLRLLSRSCEECRYQTGCLAQVPAHHTQEKSKLWLYLMAAGMLPVAMVGATQGWERVAVSLQNTRFGERYLPVPSKRKRQEVDLSGSVPDKIPAPNTKLQLCGCGCGKDATSSKGGYEVAGGFLWLKEHFCCSACATPLIGKMRTAPLRPGAGDESWSWVFIKEGRLYCAEHYASHFCKRCYHCEASLDNCDFLLDPKTGRAGCVSCHKSLGEQELFADHTNNTITDLEQGEKLFNEVKHTLTELLGLDFFGDVPLAIVDSQEMRRVKSGATKGNSSSPSLGLTVKALLKESQYFKPQKILILKGMSRLTTGSVMAHELMHYWLAVNVFNNKERNDLIPVEMEEGVCELVSYLWLLNEKQTSLKKNPVNTGMEDVLIELVRMENNDEQNQGLPFHKAFRAAQGRTLREFLSFVMNKGQYPPSLSPSVVPTCK